RSPDPSQPARTVTSPPRLPGRWLLASIGPLMTMLRPPINVAPPPESPALTSTRAALPIVTSRPVSTHRQPPQVSPVGPRAVTDPLMIVLPRATSVMVPPPPSGDAPSELMMAPLGAVTLPKPPSMQRSPPQPPVLNGPLAPFLIMLPSTHPPPPPLPPTHPPPRHP